MALLVRYGMLALTLLAALPAAAQVDRSTLLGGSPIRAVIDDQRIGMNQENANITTGLPQVELDSDAPVTMQADEVGYDQENAIVVARGHVEVIQGANILNAEQITYFQRLNLMQASGDVSMLQATGDVYFADYVELKDNMKTGIIHNFRARLSDNSVFAANEAYKINQNVTELTKAAYTPCKICKDAAPFWQLKANEVRIDEAQERITYSNAHMEMFGVPVMYTPRFSHPTPDADAKSGFLTPEYSTTSNMGTIAKVPYYWRISPDKDILLTPWYSSTEGPLLEGDYGQLTNEGKYRVQFSGTFPDKIDSTGRTVGGNEFRGHIIAEGVEGLSEYSRVGFDINRASDDTYLRRYHFGENERALFSRVYAEAAKDRNYAYAQGLSIQGLRATDDPDITPLVLPTLEGYYETDPYDSGLRLHAFANAQSLTRDVGVDQHRLSMTGGATLPIVTDNGQLITTTLNLRQDIYSVNDVPVGSTQFDGSETRTIPQAALEWRYPLIRASGGDAVTIEPIMLAVAQPAGGNPVEISNEDNTLIELTDTNLFAIDRMPGLDTVDSGSRFAYGFRSQYLFDTGQSIDTLLGQNYNFTDTPFPNSNRPDENLSDLIGRVALNYRPFVVGYRFALDRSSLESNRNELTVDYSGSKGYRIGGVYRSLSNNRYVDDSEEGVVYGAMPLSDEWTIYGQARRDLDLDQMIATNAGLLYRNECFSLLLQSLRTYTRDRDIEPATEFSLRVGFKNLGEFGGN
jgi:LPS-assembly protein